MNGTTPGKNYDDAFQRLRRAYLIALGLIALAVIAEQWSVGTFLNDQRDDAEIINVAGRQRMLSQRITKTLLLDQSGGDLLRVEFMDRHSWLKQQPVGPEVLAKLTSLDTVVTSFLAAGPLVADSLAEIFLTRMDGIVGDISTNAAAKVVRLQRAKRWLGAITLGILFLELLFIFRPISRFVRNRITELKGERLAQETAKVAAEKAVSAREESLRELHALNEALDEAVLFATLRRDGSPLFISTLLSKMIGWWEDGGRRPLSAALHSDTDLTRQYAEAFDKARAGSQNGEWAILDATGNIRWLAVTIIPARKVGSDTELFFLATDVTRQKLDEAELTRINQERLEEEVQRGHNRSRQIAAAQEKERLRIARDLHDGIGQKLTGLKYSLESLRLGPEDNNARKVERLRDLAKEIILSVRVATFNLSPPELADYGLAAGLEKLCRELSRLTGQRIVFENQGFDVRFDAAQEVNLYRVVQEAINNAIKYAEAELIFVTISPGEQLFSVTIVDDGRGFDQDTIEDRPADSSGLGMRNMTGRVEDLNGRLFVRSSSETGTKVTINLPMPDVA
ncbi:sensor histidine kinase [Lewinella sp. 4G2]|uniref:sensor histidine kinase n=1 Tax=Lewinella sp. 4G2 TaxID=1803372 RepID=UPI0007B47F23|nr:sensor histidine kinase [Lewinella sp. 4G2]OAV44566.1 hypothetical protein A3850_008705 [Lewinella sp. 4G2]